ncbi:MAG TPA: PfkB family carbohydrate kinase [Acidobacteriota bacterium]|nr:PfkB family carbohydrate kinase [Acidobacteriota bacterium]
MSEAVPDKKGLLELAGRLAGKRVLVYGDFVLDEFLFGQIDRISREAPVFIVAHERSDFRPGCAANAVANLAALGAVPLPCGILGDDEAADQLAGLFAATGIDTDNLERVKSARTAVKTRVIAGGAHSIKQQIVRIDRLNGASGGPQQDESIRRHLKSLLPECEAVLISDYGIGSLNAETASWLVLEARTAGLPVTADSRYRMLNYAGATAMTPNQPEVEQCLGRSIGNADEMHHAGKELLSKLGCEALVITRGGDGMCLFGPSTGPLDIPAFGNEEVVDVTGAGDTVIAAFTLGIAAGGGFENAARLANVAGGLTVLKKGTSTVSAEELRAALGGS